jgi:hypothetical protein
LTPSRETPIQGATAKSAFFQQLPPELRRKIYIAAFTWTCGSITQTFLAQAMRAFSRIICTRAVALLRLTGAGGVVSATGIQ